MRLWFQLSSNSRNHTYNHSAPKALLRLTVIPGDSCIPVSLTRNQELMRVPQTITAYPSTALSSSQLHQHTCSHYNSTAAYFSYYILFIHSFILCFYSQSGTALYLIIRSSRKEVACPWVAHNPMGFKSKTITVPKGSYSPSLSLPPHIHVCLYMYIHI